jgi:hypothetical protein
MHAESLTNKMLKDERVITSHVYETVGNLIQQRPSLSEDRLLRSRKLVVLMLLRPSTVVHVWQGTSSAVGHGTSEGVVMHLVVRDIASRILNGCLWWRNQQCVYTTYWAVWRLTLVQEV